MKIAGSLMVIIFSAMVGIKLISYKKAQIQFINDFIYLCEYVEILLKSSLIDTEEIIRRLEDDERLSRYNIANLEDFCLLPSSSRSRIIEFKNTIGRFDADIQLEKIEGIRLYFSSLKNIYEDNYKKHNKLYLALSASTGIITIILFA